MTKIVRLEDNIVREIIPAEISMNELSYWYNESFAAQCLEAPDDVEQHWRYVDGEFLPPLLPFEPSESELDSILQLRADIEYLSMMTGVDL